MNISAPDARPLASGQPRPRLARWRACGYAAVLWLGAAGLCPAATPDSLDTTFEPQLPDRMVRPLTKVTPAGKLLVAQLYVGLRRLNLDGSVDAGFTAQFGESTVPLQVEVLSDGRFYVAGHFFPDPDTQITRVVRLLPDGQRDPAFAGGAGVILERAVGEDIWISALRLTPDGKVLVTGQFARAGGIARRNMVQLTAEGTVDPGFEPGAEASLGVLHADVQTDGKVVAGGYFKRPGLASIRVARLNADGTLDSTFQPGAGPDMEPLGVRVQADGGILIAGSFRYVSGWRRPGLARLRPDGSVDPAFDPGVGIRDGWYATASAAAPTVLPNGKILLHGNFHSYDGVPHQFLVRLNPDGSLDDSFGPGFGGDKPVGGMDVLPDGRLAVAGQFTEVSGVARPGLAMLQGGEPAPAAPVVSIGAGRLVSEGMPVVFLATVSGSPPPALQWRKNGVDIPGATGRGLTLPSVWVADAGSYRLFASNSLGTALSEQAVITVGPMARTPGSLDPTFNPRFGREFHYATAVQSDGRALAVNAIPETGATTSSWLMRFHEDGSVDPAFDPGPDPGLARGQVLAVDGSDRILVGGIPQPAIPSGLLRLLPDGAWDSSFAPGEAAHLRGTGQIQGLWIGSNSLDVLGYFESSSAPYTTRLLRLTESGALDPGFNATRVCLHGSEGQSPVRLPDASVWAPGSFYPDPECHYPQTAQLVRFDPTGALDTNFLVRALQPTYPPETMALQPDGKALVGGRFAGVGTHLQPSLARLNPDGTFDPSFTPFIDLNYPREPDDDDWEDWQEESWETVRSVVNTIALDADGGIYIAGDFDRVDGVVRPGFARLLPNGSLDLSFQPAAVTTEPPSSVRSQIRRLHVLPDGDLLVSGSFTAYGGAQRLGIARVFGLGPGQVVTVPDAALEQALRHALGKETGPLTTRDLGRLTTLDLSRRGILSLEGLEHARSLHALILDGNAVSDLRPVGGLPVLATLSLVDNASADLSPLLSRLSLRHLCLEAALAGGANAEVVATLRARGVAVATSGLAAPPEPGRMSIARAARAVQAGSHATAYAPMIEWGLRLGWPAEPGRVYHLESSTDLGEWQDAGWAPLSSDQPVLTVDLAQPPSGQRFFRLRLQP